MSMVFLADPRPRLEVEEWEQGEVCAFITEGDTSQTHWRERDTDEPREKD